MKIRAFRLILPLALGLLAAPVLGEAQKKAGKLPVVGFLAIGSNQLKLVRQGLRHHGLVDGENIVIEWRSAEKKPERFPALAAELVEHGVDVLVAPGTKDALAARKATSTIPIVMVYVGDPVGVGLIESFARPGGNVTGSSWAVPRLMAKQLQLLKEVRPELGRVAALWDPNPGETEYVNHLKAGARSLRVQLQALRVGTVEELENAFTAMRRERAEGIVASGTAWLAHQGKRIAEFGLERRVPVIGNAHRYVRAGALMSYSPSLPALWRRAGYYVDRILKGANPADLPVERPAKFELWINLKTAKALGLTIPPSVLLRADKVIR